MLRGMWDLPGPRIEPVSSALAGGFLTTAPPGKSVRAFLNKIPKAQTIKKEIGKFDNIKSKNFFVSKDP